MNLFSKSMASRVSVISSTSSSEAYFAGFPVRSSRAIPQEWIIMPSFDGAIVTCIPERWAALM